MSSLRPVGRSAATLDKDRKSLCHFTLADGRQCRTPRSPHHPHFCSDHARKDSQARAADKLASDLSYFFSGEYLSACDLSAALGRLIAAVARGDVKPRSARLRIRTARITPTPSPTRRPALILSFRAERGICFFRITGSLFTNHPRLTTGSVTAH